MKPTPRPRLQGDTIDRLVELTRIDLSPERKAISGPAFDDLLHLIDQVDALDLGDAPPESTFDARWER